MAAVVRQVMTEHGAVGPGYSINDPEVDALSAAYSAPRHAFFVVVEPGSDGTERVLGGAGIAPLASGDATTCELRKMYFLPEARGRGLGRQMLARCIESARGFGFDRCYLETLASMGDAARLYEAAGFRRLGAPLGATGHFTCNRWYLLDVPGAARVSP
ncbi:MAG: GNAT family N-acetyltransferase [Steroidobacteraceae bacterium]|jgi:putative acetyltransferase|nr:GNAT family N-acetyltransferase [Steroidobacteraceae bacterium]